MFSVVAFNFVIIFGYGLSYLMDVFFLFGSVYSLLWMFFFFVLM